MTRPPTKREKDEINAGADALLYPGGGGVAVWVRRDELMPRAAIRFHSRHAGGERIDDVQIIAIAAALRVGMERMQHALADEMGMEREGFARAVQTAYEAIGPKYAAATEIRR